MRHEVAANVNISLYKLLVKLSTDQYREEDTAEGIQWFALIVASGIGDAKYLESKVFLRDCARLRLTPSLVLAIFNNIDNGLEILKHVEIDTPNDEEMES